MMRFTSLVFVLALLSPSIASAQRTLAQDTMSMDSPVAVSCGFCGMEAYGVIFQRIGGSGGLLPTDFPLTVQTVSLALGAAAVTGTPGACHGIAAPVDPDTLVHVEIWAGTGTPPDAASLTSMPPPGMAWPGEDMVFSLDDVPVTMSIPTTDGAADFNLMLNTLALDDGTTPAPMVDGTHSYLRVVVVLNDGGMSTTCTPVTAAPSGFPLRDDDGVVANHRSLIFAQGGVGWLWNETAGVRGDWGIRLGIQSLPHADSGVTIDAGMPATDTGVAAVDAGVRTDAAVTGGGGGSCACRVGTRRSSTPALLALVGLGLVLAARRLRART